MDNNLVTNRDRLQMGICASRVFLEGATYQRYACCLAGRALLFEFNIIFSRHYYHRSIKTSQLYSKSCVGYHLLSHTLRLNCFVFFPRSFLLFSQFLSEPAPDQRADPHCLYRPKLFCPPHPFPLQLCQIQYTFCQGTESHSKR